MRKQKKHKVWLIYCATESLILRENPRFAVNFFATNIQKLRQLISNVFHAFRFFASNVHVFQEFVFLMSE